MTLMQKVDDFGYQDFLVVPVAQGDVLPALARSLGADAAEAGIFDAASYSPPFLFRLLMRAMGMGVAAGGPPRLAAPTAPPDDLPLRPVQSGVLRRASRSRSRLSAGQ